MIRNAVTSRIFRRTTVIVRWSRLYADGANVLFKGGAALTLDQQSKPCLLYTYFVGPKQAGQGSALPCLSEGHYVLIFHCELEAPREVKLTRNQYGKEKRNPPTSNRGVTRLGSNPYILSGDA